MIKNLLIATQNKAIKTNYVSAKNDNHLKNANLGYSVIEMKQLHNKSTQKTSTKGIQKQS